MSLYALLKSPSEDAGDTLHANTMTVEDETVWDGIQSGVFRGETHKRLSCGTVIQMIADDVQDAQDKLGDLALVRSGHVNAELRGVRLDTIRQRNDCANLVPLEWMSETSIPHARPAAQFQWPGVGCVH